MSILKPVRGLDFEARENFISHCEQHYPEFEILFGVTGADEPVVPLVQELQRTYGEERVRLVIAPHEAMNPKAGLLAELARRARHDVMVLTDSDVRLPPDGVARAIAPLADPAVGLVTLPYRGDRVLSLAAALEALGMGAEFLPGVLVGRQVLHTAFALGPGNAVRRDALDAIGGFDAVSRYLADDYQLGFQIGATGRRVEVSDVVISAVLGRTSLRVWWEREVRWARTIRMNRRMHYPGLLATFSTPLALLATLAFAWWPALLGSLAVRWYVAWRMTGWMGDRALRRWLWLVPLRDLLSPAIWAAGLVGRHVSWRGRTFRVAPDGRLHEPPVARTESRTVVLLRRVAALRWRALLAPALAVGLLIAATALTVWCFVDLRTLVRVLEGGRWPWLAAAIAAHVAYLCAYAVLYRLGFAIVGVASRTWSLVPVVFTGLFVNLVVPTGAGAAAVFVDDAVRRGQDGARAAVGFVLVLLLDLLAIIPFMVWGIAFLIHERLFARWQLLAAACFVIYVGLLVVLLALSRTRQARVSRVLGWSCRVIQRPLRWVRLPGPAEDWPSRTAAGLAEAAAAIAGNPGRLALAWLSAIALHLVNALGLWLFVRGFGAHVPLGGLVAAFALGIVLHVVAVIPQLAPVSQAFMTATFIGVGMAVGPAVAAPLASRGLTLGLPLVLGLPFAWRIGRFRVGARRRARGSGDGPLA